MFTGVPLPQHSSSGARLGGTSAHEEPPLAILLMIFMTTKAIGGHSGDWTYPKIGPDLTRSVVLVQHSEFYFGFSF